MNRPADTNVLRVVFFNRSYWPDTGATGQLLTELAEDLVAQHACEVTVVTGYPLRSTSPLPKMEDRHGVRIVRAAGTAFHPRRFAARATNYVTYFASACLAALRIRHADVVVAMTDPPIIGLAAQVAARRSGARFVFLCEDVFPEVTALLEDFRSTTVDSVLARISRYLLRRADAIVALGDTMKARLVAGKGADPQKVAVIHNWADCDALAPGAKDNAFSRAHGLEDRFVVMHAGNIGLSQSFDVILDAASRLRDRERIRFVMVGDGSKRAAVQASVDALGLDNVVFLPYQPRERMAESYAAADVFLITLKPGLAGYIVPSKLYTILAAGRPYVAAVEPECEVAQITREHGCGVSVAPGDGEAMAAAILTLYEDRQQAALLGARARATALTFDRPRQVGAYADLLTRLQAQGAGRPGRLQVPGRPSTPLKRVFDVLLSGAGLIVSAPIWLLVALAIRLEDSGPVFFTQRRVGLHGRTFRAFKFRSMVPDAASRPATQATEHDPRVTRIGGLLRATALDELPQLLNILRGDMSFVGPRPLAEGEIEVGEGTFVRLAEIPGYAQRHAVRPGLTGITQVFARRDLPRARKFRLDQLYVRRASLWLDLRLISLSFWITFRGRWEDRGRKV